MNSQKNPLSTTPKEQNSPSTSAPGATGTTSDMSQKTIVTGPSTSIGADELISVVEDTLDGSLYLNEVIEVQNGELSVKFTSKRAMFNGEKFQVIVRKVS